MKKTDLVQCIGLLDAIRLSEACHRGTYRGTPRGTHRRTDRGGTRERLYIPFYAESLARKAPFFAHLPISLSAKHRLIREYGGLFLYVPKMSLLTRPLFVARLHQLGVKPGQIARLLAVSKSTVHYHLSRPLPKFFRKQPLLCLFAPEQEPQTKPGD